MTYSSCPSPAERVGRVAGRRPVGWGRLVGGVREFLMVKIWHAMYAFFRALSRIDSAEKIKLSDQLYLRLPDTRLTLVSLIGAADAIKLSVEDAREIFKSIKSACDTQDIRETKVGELSWKTDGRTRSADQDHMVIQFNGPSGFTRIPVKRDEIAAALAEFETKFGISGFPSSPGLTR